MAKKNYKAKKRLQMGRKPKTDGKAGGSTVVNSGQVFSLDSTKDKDLIDFLIERKLAEPYVEPKAPKVVEDVT